MTLVAGLLSGLLAGSLSEYWVHRLQHWKVIRGDQHVAHHLANSVRGWVPEFLAYLRPAILPIALGAFGFWYFLDEAAAFGWVMGTCSYTAFLAYVHEMYHTDPNLVFWIKRPIHYFHHKHNQWRYNFAFTTTLWDRLFGTYKDDPDWKPTKVPLRRIFSIRWI